MLQFFDDEFILMVDDANMKGVVESVEDFVKHKKLKVIFEKKILTDVPEDKPVPPLATLTSPVTMFSISILLSAILCISYS